MKNTRRTFLKGTAAGAASLYLPSTWSRAQGSNEAVRVAVIGCGGKGSGHLGDLLNNGERWGGRVTAVCDADQNHVDAALSKCDSKNVKATGYQDFRKVLDDKNVDAVLIATPNHLHSLIAIWALEAGKHVYVEKPVSHNIWEGRMLVKYAEKYKGKLIVQHGMQRRSSPGWAEAVAWSWAKDCPLGKPTLVRGLCYKARQSIGKLTEPKQAPSTVDYSLWSGPRDNKLPVMRERFHYDWHWQWPYGNGDIGNQGPHQLDVARWLINDPMEHPTSILSIGGRFGYEDDATTANTQIAYFDMKPIPMIFEVRGLPRTDLDWKKGMDSYPEKGGTGVGNVLHFEGGYLCESKAYDKDHKMVQKFSVGEPGDRHVQIFLNSIRSLQHPATHGALNGHLSAALAHMANTSYRLGKEMKAEEITATLKDNPAFAETYQRMLTHLEANKLSLAEVKPVLGAHLGFDSQTETYTGPNADAAKKITEETATYRDPFTIKPV